MLFYPEVNKTFLVIECKSMEKRSLELHSYVYKRNRVYVVPNDRCNKTLIGVYILNKIVTLQI